VADEGSGALDQILFGGQGNSKERDEMEIMFVRKVPGFEFGERAMLPLAHAIRFVAAGAAEFTFDGDRERYRREVSAAKAAQAGSALFSKWPKDDGKDS